MDIINSKVRFDFTIFASIGYVYSFVISLVFLNYYRNKKYTNCFIFLINVFHLSLIFFLPIIAYITLTREKSFAAIKDSNKCYLVIKIINLTNHALNKFIYPLFVVYYKSGYISFKNKFANITLSDLCYELYAYLFIVLIAIIYFPLKDELMSIYHNDDILYFLNYLNILDLFLTYFEIGFSCGSLLRYFYAVFNRRDEYKQFILGKLSLYEKNIKAEFIRRFTRFMTLSNLYSADIHKYKFNEVNKFIADIDTQKYYDKDHYKQPFEKVENIKKVDLERVLAKSYGLSKGLFRKMRRIEIIREHQINGIKRNRKKRCCDCVYRLCIASCCKRIKCLIFAVVCLAVLAGEVLYFIRNNDNVIEIYKNKNQTTQVNETVFNYVSLLENIASNITDQTPIDNTTINHSTSNDTNTNIGTQIGYTILLYPFYLLTIFVTCGLYIIPIFYGITRRTFITGDFMYERSSSDTLEMVISVRKLSTKIFSSLYLGSLFFITIFLRDTFPVNSKGEYNEFLKFFEVPYSPYILAVRYVYIFVVIILTRLVEKISMKCCEINICDECYFEPRTCEPCVKPCVLPQREKYIEEGRREVERLLNEENNNINTTNDSNKIQLLS